METEQAAAKFEQWAVVEIMGHQKYAGLVSEQPLAGTNLLRIDVPAIGERLAFTKLFGGGSIFCITPCSEEAARSVAARCHEAPVTVYAPSVQRAIGYDEDEVPY